MCSRSTSSDPATGDDNPISSTDTRHIALWIHTDGMPAPDVPVDEIITTSSRYAQLPITIWVGNAANLSQDEHEQLTAVGLEPHGQSWNFTRPP